MDIPTIIGLSGISLTTALGFVATIARMYATNERAKAELTIKTLLDWSYKLEHDTDRCFLLSKAFTNDEIERVWKKQELVLQNKSCKTLLESIFGEGKVSETEDGKVKLCESQVQLIEFHWKTLINRVESIVTAWDEYLVDEDIMIRQFGRYLYNADTNLNRLLIGEAETDYETTKLFLKEKKYIRENRKPKRMWILRLMSK
jgi:hypothetical protein